MSALWPLQYHCIVIILRNPLTGTATATAAGQVDAASRGALVSVSRVVFAEVNNDRCCRRSGDHNR